MTTTAWPNLRELAQDFYERSYADGDCWRLVSELLEAGGFGPVANDPLKAIKLVQEIWFQDDPRDPLALLQPWDWLLFMQRSSTKLHVALVVDPVGMIHAHRHAGVRIEPLQRWRHRLLQVARLRQLM